MEKDNRSHIFSSTARHILVCAALCIISLLFIVCILFFLKPSVQIPVWLKILIIVVSVDIIIVILSCLLIDIVLPDDFSKPGYSDHLIDDPNAFGYLDDLVIEPDEYQLQISHLEELLNREDSSKHAHLTGSRKTDREILRICDNDNLIGFSFEDIARGYGVTEDDLVLFLYSHSPETLFRRIYYRNLYNAGMLQSDNNSRDDRI